MCVQHSAGLILDDERNTCNNIWMSLPQVAACCHHSGDNESHHTVDHHGDITLTLQVHCHLTHWGMDSPHPTGDEVNVRESNLADCVRCKVEGVRCKV